MRGSRAVIPVLALSTPALAAGLDCTFTTLCSPLTECQDHPGLPFAFTLTSIGLEFPGPDGPVAGRLLDHVTPPALSVLFDAAPDSTILLTVSGSGEAVMVQTDLLPGDRVQSVSYFGTCEPGT